MLDTLEKGLDKKLPLPKVSPEAAIAPDVEADAALDAFGKNLKKVATPDKNMMN